MTTTVSDRTPASRSALRAVAVPSEHGGWGLTFEPVLLGLIVAPSLAGVCLGAAAVIAFLARTPLKIALVDLRRHRTLPRTTLAWRLAAAELVALAVLVALAWQLAAAPFWWPAAIAAPLILVEGWYEVRSRGRRLVPELAGAVGVCSVAAMIIVADRGSARLATAVWAVLAARVVTSIPFVRGQIARLHGRPVSPAVWAATDSAALVAAVAAVALDRDALAGAVAVAAVVALQRLSARGPVPRPAVLGIRQMAMGFGVAIVTALGVLAAAS